MPVDRFRESITVTRCSASSSLAARRMALPELDIESEILKQTTSLPASTKGRISSIASSIDGAEVFGVVLFSSDHL